MVEEAKHSDQHQTCRSQISHQGLKGTLKGNTWLREMLKSEKLCQSTKV